MKRRTLGIALAVAACQGRAPEPKAVAPDEVVLRLERTPCFGSCPTYVATVRANGTGEIRGTTRAEGFVHPIAVDTAALSTLLVHFERKGFFQLDTAYIPGHTLCDLHATDHPGATLFARIGEQSHEVQHYHGCRGARGASPDDALPAPLALLASLEDAVDSLVDVAAVVEGLRGR